jgi:MarR family 2-MHQ and catechol resistance regulon transcriptional repressor
METHHKETKKKIEALSTYIKLIRAAESLSARVNLSLSNYDLTESQFGVLEALHHLGPLSQTALAKKLLKSGGNMTTVIDNLEKNGLVERKRGMVHQNSAKRDRRFFSVHLTSKGKNKINEVLPNQIKLIVDEIGILNADEQKELQRLCKIVGLKRR